ncbi:hypothetical protein BVX94_01580, partial [bacterium B17]
DNELHPVLDFFYIGTNQPVKKGAVNVNTLQTDVLKAVFTEMDIRTNGPIQLTESDAEDLATELIDYGPYMNLSSIGEADWQTIASNIPTMTDMDDMCDLDVEALIGNSAALLCSRQQIFYIIIRMDYNTAVACVWRDTYKNEDGTHPMFIRYMQIL